jgi:hypothetical protein
MAASIPKARRRSPIKRRRSSVSRRRQLEQLAGGIPMTERQVAERNELMRTALFGSTAAVKDPRYKARAERFSKHRLGQAAYAERKQRGGLVRAKRAKPKGVWIHVRAHRRRRPGAA